MTKTIPSLKPLFLKLQEQNKDRQQGVFLPIININETHENIYIEIVAMGFNENNIKIETDDDLLTVYGEYVESRDDEARKVHGYSFFERSFNLPVRKNEDIDIVYYEGIIKITIDKIKATELTGLAPA